MTATRPQISAGRRRLRLFLIVLVVAAAFWQLAAYFLNRSLSSTLAAYQGPSLAIKDYVPPVLPPGEPNGWDAVAAVQLLMEGQQAYKRQIGGAASRDLDPELQKIGLRFRELDRQGARPDAADLDRFRAALARHELPMSLLEGALKNAREARFYTDYTVVGYAVEVPNHMFSLRLGTLLRARAEIALAEGRPAEAWTAAKDIYRLAYWNASATPFLISGLVARAIAQQGATTVQLLLAVAPADAAVRAEVLAEASRLDPKPYFDRLFAAETAGMYSSLLDPRFGKDSLSVGPEGNRSFFPPLGHLLFDWEPWRNYNAAAYLRYMTTVNEVCRQPSFSQGPDAARKVVAARQKTTVQPAASLLFDCLDSSAKRDLWLASIDQLKIAFELERFRDQNGRYPQTLAEARAAAAAAVDPFSNQPYIYRTAGNGYLLYSVSLNGQDDGGKSVREKGGQIDFRSGDWVWKVAAAG